MSWYICILLNKKKWTLYTWVTNDLVRRVYEHKNKLNDDFTSKYWLNKLVYYEFIDNIELAIIREKQIKAWNRDNKIKLIESINKERNDLYKEICE